MTNRLSQNKKHTISQHCYTGIKGSVVLTTSYVLPWLWENSFFLKENVLI